MRSYAQYAAASRSIQDDYRSDRESDFGALHPSERIGRPLGMRTGLSLPWGGILAAIAVTSGLILFEAGPGWRDEDTGRNTLFRPAPAGPTPGVAEQLQRRPAPTAASETRSDVPALPRMKLQEVVAPANAMPYKAAPPSTEPSTSAAAPPSPVEPREVAATYADLAQKRAVEAGLHPGLSRVLLGRLSANDFRNAGIAIETALSNTADSGSFIWPQRPSPNVARFRVRFVTGAAPGCRRYIVEVVKDRWVTTALPVEKCGVKSPRVSHG